MAITQNESTFLGFGFEMILYGIYMVLFSMAFASLTWRRKTDSIQKFYLFFCCFLFSCCTIHVFIKFRYFFKDLIQHPDGTIEAGAPALRAADALVTLIDFFAEIVLLYRLWCIWNRNNYIIILPFIISLAFVSCAMATIGILVSTPTAAIVPPSLVPLGTAAFAIPLCFNFIVTGLIIGRIWYQGRQRHNALVNSGAAILPRAYLKDALTLIIESGMLYLVVQFVFTVLFAINHPAQIMLSDIATQIYGIAPTLIFVRVGLGNSAGSSQRPNHRSGYAHQKSSYNGKSSGTGTNLSIVHSPTGRKSPMMSIPVTTTVETHKDPAGWNYELHNLSKSEV